MIRRAFPALVVAIALALGALAPRGTLAAADTVPARFSDREFWSLVTDFSGLYLIVLPPPACRRST